MPLPRLVTPDIERLQRAIADDDIDALDAAYPAVAARVDTTPARLGLLRNVHTLRDEQRIPTALAAVAALDLAYPNSSLARASIIEAVAVQTGTVRTASGLLVIAR
jgi:hypothetical protein